METKIKKLKLPEIDRRRYIRLKRSRLTETPHQQGYLIKIAHRREDYGDAFKLVYERYREVGLLPALPSRMWYSIYHFLPDTNVAIATFLENETGAISTATIIMDSPLGLPSDSIYKDEIDELRASGRKIAEVSSLAAVPSSQARNSFMHVFRMVGLISRYMKVDSLLASVNPKHAAFYEDVLLFEPKGDLKYYPHLTDAPAILEHLDFRNIKSLYGNTYSGYPPEFNVSDFLFGKDFRDLDMVDQVLGSQLKKNKWSFEDICYFLCEKSDLWFKASSDQKAYLEKVYPGLSQYIESTYNRFAGCYGQTALHM